MSEHWHLHNRMNEIAFTHNQEEVYARKHFAER